MDVGDSISATLRKSFSKRVISALKSTIVKEKENLEEDVHFIIDHATEVCLFVLLLSKRARELTKPSNASEHANVQSIVVFNIFDQKLFVVTCNRELWRVTLHD